MQALHIRPQAREAGIIWLPLEDAIGAALPTPIRKILLSLR
jgi:A/G-specific adenine glycosylase